MSRWRCNPPPYSLPATYWSHSYIAAHTLKGILFTLCSAVFMTSISIHQIPFAQLLPNIFDSLSTHMQYPLVTIQMCSCLVLLFSDHDDKKFSVYAFFIIYLTLGRYSFPRLLDPSCTWHGWGPDPSDHLCTLSN